MWATADSIQDAADVATSRVSEWDRVSGLPPLATWDIEGFAISVCRQSGAAEGKMQQRDTKRQALVTATAIPPLSLRLVGIGAGIAESAKPRSTPQAS